MSDTKIKKKEAMGGRETSVQSSTFRLRRVHNVIVVESLSSRLTEGDSLLDVVDQALQKPGDGIIIHLPTPTYVTSQFLRCLRDAGERIAAAGRPFVAVVHPKMRLLIEMFNLQDELPTVKSLVDALDAVKPGALDSPL